MTLDGIQAPTSSEMPLGTALSKLRRFSPDSYSTQATALAFLVNPRLTPMWWRDAHVPTLSVFQSDGPKLDFGLDAGIVKSCGALSSRDSAPPGVF
jgi:hypothetical protein